MTEEDKVRWSFEQLMHFNGRSVERDRDGSYWYHNTRDAWIAYKAGYKYGKQLKENDEPMC